MSANLFEKHIPNALRSRERWICWRSDQRNGKPTKAPVNPRTGRLMSVTDCSAWASFEGAKAGWERFYCDGLGFVLNGDGVVGIDLDHCVNWDGEQPEIDQQAQAVIRSLNSYTEFSPSRRGIHIFVFGSLPEVSRRNEAARVEIYSNHQYLTVTGDIVPESTGIVRNRAKVLLAFHSEFFPHRHRELSPGFSVDARLIRRTGRGWPDSLDDDSLLERARSARNGTRFRELFDDGSLGGYSSDSEADLALCLILAFWTGRDPRQIDRLFRRSARMRDKWEREDYRNRTIVRALDRVQVTWKPRRY